MWFSSFFFYIKNNIFCSVLGHVPRKRKVPSFLFLMNAVSPALLEVLKAILYNTYLSVEKGKEVMITLRGEEGRRKREYNENKRLENEGKENRD